MRINNLRKANKGITLIALVITIIVLLILAAISIATLTGENGILTKADDAKTETRGASVQEARDLWKINQEADKQTDNATAQTLEELIADLVNQSLLTEEERDQVLGNAEKGIKAKGQVTIGSRTIVFKEIDIVDYIKVGDYVDYNPTIATKDGTTKIDASKLSYTSPTGTATSHGNGYTTEEDGGGQTFTATADTRWRVLSIENGKVELISENPIKTNDNENFILKGAIGYLYAEQELNEVCKIFGYGYGADTTMGGNYLTGGPKDTPITGKIEETGARSITIEDINRKAGVYQDKTDGQMKYSNGKVIFSDYGRIKNLDSNIYYPTVNGDSTTGKSNSAELKELKYTYYGYNKLKIENTGVRDILFNGNYWIATRCVIPVYDSASFNVWTVYDDVANAQYPCDGNKYGLFELTKAGYAVRPVVTLKSDIIDISTNYESENRWKLK